MTRAISSRLVPNQPFRGLIQVAGAHDLAEALEVHAAGAHCLGLPLRLPVHRPDLDEARAAELIAALPDALQTVCITYETDPQALATLCARLNCAAVQLHADPPTRQGVALLSALKAALPRLYVIKSLIVRPEQGVLRDLLQTARTYAPVADAFITDSFDPATGACGATGRTHPWEISRALAQALDKQNKPLILAGGLHPENVRQAILEVRPAGVDAHTGLEGPDGKKDPARLRRFVQEAKAGFAALTGV